MDTKIEIKEEDPPSDNIDSHKEREFHIKNVIIKTNYNAEPLDYDYDLAIKPKFKSEIAFSDFGSQEEKTCFTIHSTNQMKSETIAGSNSCRTDTEREIEEQTLISDFGSQNDREFVPEDPSMKIMKYSCDREVDNKLEIKEEQWQLDTKASSLCENIKYEDLSPVKSLRICIEAAFNDNSDKSSLCYAEVSGKDPRFHDAMHHPECANQGRDITEIQAVEECVITEQCGTHTDGGEIYSKTLYFKHKNVIHEGERPNKSSTCDENLTQWSELKIHSSIHKIKTMNQCTTCDKYFTRLSHLKRHSLIHEGKKPHICKTCDKSFTQLSNLVRHNLIHEGKKPHQCKICDKNFTELSNLKRHHLIHEGKKPHQCKTCDRSFTQLSDLKMHYLIHEGKKPHHCQTCNKSFTQLSNLKTHNLIHEGKKPNKCKTCGKSFTDLSNLKRHTLIHVGKKPE